MEQHFVLIRDWTKSNWRLLLTITALVGILIRVEIAIAETQRLARGAGSDAWDAKRQASQVQSVAEDANYRASSAKRIAEDAESQASRANRVAEDAKSSADSALAELESLVRALRRRP
jgi:methyl-accepting chemotaxis protein